MKRLDSVSCAICMESLFCKRDDLDEFIPIGTADCGHVFHEECVRQWFVTQNNAHVAAHREARGRSISESSDISDATNLCPTCRTEVYAHEDTGEPIIHRLYINLEGTGVDGGSSQMGSSPVKAPAAWRRISPKGKGREEAEVMGFARRAKGLGEEAKRLEEGVERTLGSKVRSLLDRGEGLEKELVSQKAVEGIKKYVGGLTAALNSLRNTITTSPTNADLRAQLVELEMKCATSVIQHKETQKQLRDCINIHLPQERAQVIEIEKAKYKKEVKKIKEEMQLLEKELAKEGILRRTARKEMEERLKAEEKKTEAALILVKKESAERVSLNKELVQRTKMLRDQQKMAADRKAAKEAIKELQAENESLRAQLSEAATAPRAFRGSTRLSSVAPDGDSDNDVGEGGDASSQVDYDESAHRSIEGISRAAPHAPKRRRISEYDESLIIELPSFASSSRIPHTHPTARTVSSDQFESGKAVPKLSSRHSKYYPPKPDSRRSPSIDTQGLIPESPSESDESPDRSAKWSRPKPNPFASTREDSEKKKILPKGIRPAFIPKPAQTRKEPIEVSSSPETRAPLRSTELNGRKPAVASGSGSGRGVPAKQPSVIDFLGLADKHGRPIKTLALGSKIRRKA